MSIAPTFFTFVQLNSAYWCEITSNNQSWKGSFTTVVFKTNKGFKPYIILIIVLKSDLKKWLESIKIQVFTLDFQKAITNILWRDSNYIIYFHFTTHLKCSRWTISFLLYHSFVSVKQLRITVHGKKNFLLLWISISCRR